MLVRPAVIGIGHTEFSRSSGRSEWELANEAIVAALTDAGLEPGDVDGLARSAYDGVDEAMVLKTFGARLSWYSQVSYGGLGAPATLGHAAAAITSKQARVVVAYRALNGYSETRYGRAERSLRGDDGTTTVARGDRAPSGAFAAPYGILSPGQIMAMWARRYQAENCVDDDDLAAAFCRIAVDQRRYANRNPHAVMRDRVLDEATYYGGRTIAEPLRLYDFALETDGAAALVVAAPDVARSAPTRPVWIRATMQGLIRHAETLATYGELRNGPSYRAIADELYRRAGMVPADLSAAMLYDATVVTVLLALEAYHLQPTGQAWRGLLEHGIGPDSPLPVNTSGGHLSEAYVHSMNLLVEAVRQCRGTSCNQVPDAEAVLCCSGPTGLILTAS